MLATEASAFSLSDLTSGEVALGTWDASLGIDLGFGKDSSLWGGTKTSFDQRNTLFDLNIQNTGFSVIDPALVTGSAGVTLGMGKDISNADGITSAVSTGMLGYSFDAEFLNDLPYGGQFIANHSTTTTMQPFGHQENKTTNRVFGMRLNEGSPLKDMGYPYLSSNFRLETQNLDQLSTSALSQDYHLLEHRRSLVHDGHKGAETSDLDWRFEVNDIKSPLNEIGNNRSKNASLGYSADFGELLNRRWDSRISYSDDTGIKKLSTLSVNEILQIEHQSNLSTNYNYELMRVVSDGLRNQNQTGTFNVTYQPYQNLSTNASLQHQEQPTAKIDSASGGLGYQYLHDLPWEGTLHFTANTGYGLTKLHATNATGIGHVSYEGQPFKFDPLAVTQEITLKQGFVNLSAPIHVYAFNSRLFTIEATLVACPGSIMPADGTCDYIIDPPLGNKTVIRLNPLSTTLMGVSSQIDSLAVTYDYNVPSSLAYNTNSSTAGVTINYNWILFTLSHSQSDMHLISGIDTGFMQSTNRSNAQVDMKGAWKDAKGMAGFAYQVTNDTLVAYHQKHYYGALTYPYANDLVFSVNADKQSTQYQMPLRTSENRSLRFNATWYPMYDTTLNAVIGRRALSDSIQATETVDEASIKAQMKYGKIRLTSALTVNKRVRGSSELSNWRFDLNLVRNL